MLVDKLTINSLLKIKINKNKLFIYLAILFGLLRFFITSDRDILATNSPHDEFWYITTAYHFFSGKGYDNMVLAHLPTYSYFLWVGSKLGIASRLLIDIFWVGGSFYLSKVILNITNKKILVSLGIFIFLIFHPYTLNYFDRALSENLLSCLTLLLISFGIEIYFNKNINSTKIYLFSLIFGISYNVRSEGVVLLFPLIIILICHVFFNKNIKVRFLFNSKIFKAISFSIISLIVISLVISGVNFIRWGSFSKDELTSPGYSAAMKSLISIDDGPTPYQTSVTMEMLRKGGKYSPTLNEINRYLDGSTGRGWMSISEEATLIPGEIGNGWFYWALRDSAAAAGWYLSPKLADVKYRKISDELNHSFEVGDLNKRSYIFSSFIDPDYLKWIDYIYPTFKNLLKLLFFPNVAYLETRSEDASPSQMQEYTKISGRRNLLPSFEISGWILGKEEYAALFYDGNLMSYEKINVGERPDVKGARGFSLRSSFGVLPNKICFYKDLKDKTCVNIENIKTGSILEVANKEIIGIDKLSVENSKLRRLDKFFPMICRAYDEITIFLIILNIIMLVYYGFKKELKLLSVIFFSAVTLFIFSRIGLFSILGASSWSAMQARYLMPLLPFLSLIIFPVAWCIRKNDI
jgi:hypothetical protein